MTTTYTASILLPAGPRGANRNKYAVVTAAGADVPETRRYAKQYVLARFPEAEVQLTPVSTAGYFEIVRG